MKHQKSRDQGDQVKKYVKSDMVRVYKGLHLWSSGWIVIYAFHLSRQKTNTFHLIFSLTLADKTLNTCVKQ